MSEHTGLRLRIFDQIRAERERQIEKEGFTAEHDAQRHADGGLGWAAACYAAPGPLFDHQEQEIAPFDSPWDKRAKHSRGRQLVIAGALIVAELERLHLTKRGEDAAKELERELLAEA